MYECLDVEPQSGTDVQNVFSVELLEDGRLACIVQSARASRLDSAASAVALRHDRQEQNPHLLLLLSIFSDDCEQTHDLS